MRGLRKTGLIALISALASFGVLWGQKSQQISVRLTISLTGIGYKPETGCGYKGKDVPSDLTSLNDDDKLRLSFPSDGLLAVYRSACRPSLATIRSSDSKVREMEAWFVDPSTGKLVGTEAWPTAKRRWLNDRWDTQARIIPVQSGFLVHAGPFLYFYTFNREKKVQLPLDPDSRWAVKVVRPGSEIHLQEISDDESAVGRWLSSETLKQEHRQSEFAGITSASSKAAVTLLAHCLHIQPLSAKEYDLYCPASRDLGLPEFLNDSEVLAISGKSVVLLSLKSEKLWSREASSDHSIINDKISLRGNRFAILLRGRTTFDGTEVPKHKESVVVYDSEKRIQIFHSVVAGEFEVTDFALSPDGKALAVLKADNIQIYDLEN